MLSDVAKAHVREKARKPKYYRNRNRGDYLGRAIVLKELGFSTYREYLQSDLWKSIRKRVCKIKGDACFLCGNKATELHHNSYRYKDLVGKRLRYINPICHSCHGKIEFDDGEKVSVFKAAKSFKRSRKQHTGSG
jgi:hypothetical protein